MSDLLLGLGIALAIEGTLYALFPGPLRDLMRRALALPENSTRMFGIGALALGIAVVWLARG